ncbi:MAG: gamma-glutamylcyclotransferase [Burkholderiales bacterium]|nr:gamma-glutamylcyclotransferase [Burkholderiales bacterium]
MNAAAHPSHTAQRHHPHFGRPLCREDLKSGSLRAAFLASAVGAQAWSEEQLARSLDRTLAAVPPGDVWVFAYGSLIWNPLFPFVDKRIATIYGFHRSFCLWSRIGRGTPERPGLVLGLDRGGSCTGLAYRIAAAHVREELTLLWRREMVTGSYVPTWIRARTRCGAVPAVAFVINHGSPAYAGRLATPEMARCIAEASGLHGRCAEYLVRTLTGLREHGIEDRALDEVERALAALAG